MFNISSSVATNRLPNRSFWPTL